MSIDTIEKVRKILTCLLLLAVGVNWYASVTHFKIEEHFAAGGAILIVLFSLMVCRNEFSGIAHILALTALCQIVDVQENRYWAFLSYFSTVFLAFAWSMANKAFKNKSAGKRPILFGYARAICGSVFIAAIVTKVDKETLLMPAHLLLICAVVGVTIAYRYEERWRWNFALFVVVAFLLVIDIDRVYVHHQVLALLGAALGPLAVLGKVRDEFEPPVHT